MSTYNISDFLAEVEADITWREAEVRSLYRLISKETDQSTIEALRRSYIALLYAHAEGGVKISLAGYVRIINESGLSIEECIPTLVAAAHSDLFRALADQSVKHDFFKNRLPDNTRLHRFARQAEFMGKIRIIEKLPIEINQESIVDTESNLDSIVLVKLLYQLGFSPDLVGKNFSELGFLRGLRNAIAHGEKRVPTREQCDKYNKTVFKLLPQLRDLLAKAIRQKSFKRNLAS